MKNKIDIEDIIYGLFFEREIDEQLQEAINDVSKTAVALEETFKEGQLRLFENFDRARNKREEITQKRLISFVLEFIRAVNK